MKDFFRHNGILILIAAVLLTGILAIVSALTPGRAFFLSDLTGLITAPIQRGVGAVTGWVEGVYNYTHQYAALEEEVARLEQEIARLEAQAREGEQALEENQRLRELLELRERRSDMEFESATVLSRSATNWESTLVLSKGSQHGVEAGDCVITSTGELVGVVSEVGSRQATVITVIDPEIQMGGLVFRTDSAGILEGSFDLMTEGRLRLGYLPDDVELISGDIVLTSGRGEVYPSGLVVGSVEEVRTDVSGVFRYAVVRPAADLDHLTQAFVIKEFDQVE